MTENCQWCHSEMVVCENEDCGKVMCGGSCNGHAKRVDTEVVKGIYCTECLGGVGKTKVYLKLREYTDKKGALTLIINDELIESDFITECSRRHRKEFGEQFLHLVKQDAQHCYDFVNRNGFKIKW